MAFSKINKCLQIIPLLTMPACSTTPYRVLYQSKSSTELSVTPDRVLLECERLYDADEPGLSGFMIHVLDEENTVLTVSQGNTLDNESCDRRIKRMNEILKNGKSIYIAGIGSLDEPRRSRKAYSFPQIGTFKDNGRVLQFIALANEHGACYDAYSGEREKPCPPEPFPHWKENQ